MVEGEGRQAEPRYTLMPRLTDEGPEVPKLLTREAAKIEKLEKNYQELMARLGTLTADSVQEKIMEEKRDSRRLFDAMRVIANEMETKGDKIDLFEQEMQKFRTAVSDLQHDQALLRREFAELKNSLSSRRARSGAESSKEGSKRTRDGERDPG